MEHPRVRARDVGKANDIEASLALTVDDQAYAEKVKGADTILQYATVEAGNLDEATNSKLLRKIDRNVLPWLCGLYMLQFLDKGVLSYASVMGILDNANLTTAQFTWLGSIYYLGYIAALAPHNRLLQYFTPSKYIAVCMVLWGMVLSTMVVCNNFTQLMIQRVFLGTLEAVVNCGFVLVTAAWYRKYEHGSRVSIWSSCNGLAGIIGAIIAYGCLAGEERHKTAMTSWRIMALCLGLVSVVYGAAMWYFMAGSVVSATFFTEDEKPFAVERLRENHQGIGSHQFKWYQVREAFLDIRTWLYVLFVLCTQIPSAGLSLLSSILIKSLGFDSKTTLLLAMPSGGLQIFFQVTVGFLADKTRQRALTAIGIQTITMFAAALLVGLSKVGPLYDRNGQLAAYWIMMGGCAIAFYLVLAMVSSNVLGTTKKTTTNVILFISMAVAYLVGPQIFRDKPYYFQAKYATLSLWVASILILVVLYALNTRENKRRDANVDAYRVQLAIPGIEFMDLTDKENKWFRYVI